MVERRSGSFREDNFFFLPNGVDGEDLVWSRLAEPGLFRGMGLRHSDRGRMNSPLKRRRV